MGKIMGVDFGDRRTGIAVSAPAPHNDCDLLIVGAGPAGLAAAIRARLRRPAARVFLLDKSPAPGAHLLSGAVIDPAPLRDLLPPDAFAALPLSPPVARDAFWYLTPRRRLPLPFVPPHMRPRGLPFVSLSALARALAAYAETIGVETYFSQPVESLLWENDTVVGVHSRGDPIRAAAVVLAEGPAGTLAVEAHARLPALRPPQPPLYSLGIKRLLSLPPTAPDRTGLALHTFGHPLPSRAYGGAFLYFPAPGLAAAGLVAALDSPTPLSPHHRFLQWLDHPAVAALLPSAVPLEYGARLVPETGWPAVPPTLWQNGLGVIGDDAHLLDPMALKGVHLAVESGIALADHICTAPDFAPTAPLPPTALPSAAALRRVRNYRPPFARGLLPGIANAALLWLTRGHLPPGTLPTRPDAATPPYPLPADLPAAAARLRTIQTAIETDLAHAGLLPPPPAAPPHLALKDPAQCASCARDGIPPCLLCCPAAVYRLPDNPSPAFLPRLAPENCLHCRTCTIRCPHSNIAWLPTAAPSPHLRSM